MEIIIISTTTTTIIIIMTKACLYHKISGSDRFQLPKKGSGVGITDMHNLYNSQVK